MFELTDLSGQDDVHLQWGVKIPLRDGVNLTATVYMPSIHRTPTPAICTLTPYVAQSWHEFGLYFAARGYPFFSVDARGRGNSQGEFRPFIQEANDGYDLVEWLAQQPCCNGKVAMWGGSYAGYDQWATAKEFPPHLATIVPVASPYLAVDVPMRSNVCVPYFMQWLTFVSGRTSQDKLYFNSERFWGAKFKRWFQSGLPFKQLDAFLGNPSATFQEWASHPQQDSYWDCHNPKSNEYAKLSLPILTITGIYDADQPGALTHYRKHLENASAGGTNHFLVIGPWDHFGTRTPRAEFCGVKVGAASLVDLQKLQLEWYAWTMQGGPRPDFLQKRVAYYVMDADRWRYADTLEAVTSYTLPLFLQSTINPTDVFRSGSLSTDPPASGAPDHFVYDPRDVTHAELESTVDPDDLADQRLVNALIGKQLIYHSAQFDNDTEVSGFFRFSAWFAIDQPDTDFHVSVYEIDVDGSSIQLSSDWMRARYRESLREQKLICTQKPLLYEFQRFTFVSRRIKKGNRLRLVIRPLNSIYSQKNYNSGGVVAEESMEDSRVVTVRLFHDEAHCSALYVPIGHPDDKPQFTHDIRSAT